MKKLNITPQLGFCLLVYNSSKLARSSNHLVDSDSECFLINELVGIELTTCKFLVRCKMDLGYGEK